MTFSKLHNALMRRNQEEIMAMERDLDAYFRQISAMPVMKNVQMSIDAFRELIFLFGQFLGLTDPELLNSPEGKDSMYVLHLILDKVRDGNEQYFGMYELLLMHNGFIEGQSNSAPNMSKESKQQQAVLFDKNTKHFFQVTMSRMGPRHF